MTPPCGLWDVAIIGGGIAGAATALSLPRGLRVVMLEAGRHDRFRIGESLPPDARPILAELGVLEDFLAEGHLPCHGSASCWGSDRLGHNDFLMNPNGHGWHLDRRRFEAFLAEAAAAAGAHLRRGARVLAARRCPEGFALEIAGDPAPLRARQIVDASGPGAAIAQSLGARRVAGQALYCRYARLRADAALSPLTRIEAAPDGWWYLAKMPENQALLAFFTDPKRGRRGDLGAPAGFAAHLARTKMMAGLIAEPSLAGASLHSHLLRIGHLSPSAGAGWVAVGDAALSCDPILSQGMIAALLSGQRAGSWIAAGADFVDDASASFRASAARTCQLYAAETRWPESGFWRARSGGDSQTGR